jgi:SAM-dependent methyltransferase
MGGYGAPADNRRNYMGLYYPESRFGGFTGVDGTIAFYIRVQALLGPSATVLDVGCGRGACLDDPIRVRRELRVFRGKCARVTGIDVDPQAAGNPLIDEFRLIVGARWPVEDASVDVCVSDSVLEHVEDPEGFFAECGRVIKPAGHLCIRTSNSLNYIAIAARLIPDRFHKRLLRKSLSGHKKEQDCFATVYRCNTKGRIRRMLDRHGFEHCVYGYEAEPYHLPFSRMSYLCGVIHQRLAPSLFKSNIFVFARKTD